MPSGCSARKAATCSGRKRWCTEQWPFQSRNVASLQSASVSPPSSRRGFHTRIVVERVAHGQRRCCGRGAGRGRRAPWSPLARSAQSRTARALVDVHTAPPWRPTNALSAADEFMYVIGTTRSMSVTAASASHASSTSSMSAMSAMEQPALRSGRITCWWSAVRMSADSAMKWTPQNTMNSAAVLLLGEDATGGSCRPGRRPSA